MRVRSIEHAVTFGGYWCQFCTETELPTYHQYCVLIDNKYAKHANTDRLSIQTVHKYVYLPKTFQTTQICYNN